MAITITMNDNGTATMDDGINPAKTFSFTLGGDNLVSVNVTVGDAVVGTPVRFKLSNSGGRVAADTPGVSAEYFIVDSDNTITNG